ncbi:GNAT family N-acetyltransferase [Tepidibacillus fermentans]|uniref:GNAT family N-acetyltransferase n=1 Tax=Tepidibacillus fermentans TaxID=1281767 RepID=UPI001FB3D705|nr:GNAT family N-acetyltransferase [Tepidibacillus fermentans]
MTEHLVETSLEIRTLKQIDELEKIQELEKIVWGMSEVVPTHQTLTAVKNGGLVLGAYYDEKLVGFQYSFAGFNGKEVYLCSHMLAIHPEFRHLGIGEKLKRAQREEALKLGYQLITWTYDPLESVNAYLNIGKLGAITSTYILNAYGEMNDSLNQGLPSDRFFVEWWLNDIHVSQKSKGIRFDERNFNSKYVLIEWKVNDIGLPIATSIHLSLDQHHGYLFVPIPSKFQQLKHLDLQLATDWRMKTREVFTYYFEKGWAVTDFFKLSSDDQKGVNFYVLTKRGENRGI